MPYDSLRILATAVLYLLELSNIAEVLRVSIVGEESSVSLSHSVKWNETAFKAELPNCCTWMSMANHWSESEVEAGVQDYFSMLRLELRGEKYNKAEHRRGLIEPLNNRSHSSIELKHQNISAALIDLNMPFIDGYKPLSNYQKTLLPLVIKDYLPSAPVNYYY